MAEHTLGAVVFIGRLAVWIAIFHLVSTRTWGHSPETFAWLLGAALLLLWPWWRAPRWALPRGRRALVLALVLAGLAGWRAVSLGATLVRTVADPALAEKAVDIAVNTHLAGHHLLAGRNPYAHRSQVQYDVQAGEGVTRTAEGVRLFGVPYAHGYPYFPGMALAFLPLRAVPAFHGIRVGNGLALLAAALALLLLVPRAATQRLLAGSAAILVLLGPQALGPELFGLGVTDLLIGTLAVAGWAALVRDRAGLAGVFFGLACASKLLPGPLFLVAALAWAWPRGQGRRLLVASTATAAAVLLPFILWDPPHFLSATVLFYAAHHAGGDDTALFYFLPPALRLPFQLTGLLCTAALLGLCWRWRARPAGAPIALSVAAWFVFLAFNRMSHLNYLWAAWPLASAALVLGAVRAAPAVASSAVHSLGDPISGRRGGEAP